MKLSVLIMTFNEEKNIRECLESVKWADEIIVIDSRSTDQTIAIANEYTDKIYVRDWPGFAEQRNFCLSHASGDWVFLLDADERVSDQLRTSILETINSKSLLNAFDVTRYNEFMGRMLKGYIETHTRLFRNGCVSYTGIIHETPLYAGQAGKLSGRLYHYAYKDLHNYIDKLNSYSSLGAKERLNANKISRLSDLMARPILDFIKHYFLKGCYRDGIPGLVFAVTHSFYTFLKYAKLWEQTNSSVKRA